MGTSILFACAFSTVLLDHSHHGGMEGFVEVGDVFVDPVDGEGILDQVIRADAEEIDLFGENVRYHRR